MQTLEIISVNLWQILISLANLLIIFLILKKFLFKPVTKVMDQRQSEVDARYAAADEAAAKAQQDKEEWEKIMQGADAEADKVLKTAADTARMHGDRIVEDARQKADGILRQAQADAELEKRKAEASIKEEIVQVSTQLAQKMLEREINQADHQQMIDTFLDEIGDAHD